MQQFTTIKLTLWQRTGGRQQLVTVLSVDMSCHNNNDTWPSFMLDITSIIWSRPVVPIHLIMSEIGVTLPQTHVVKFGKQYAIWKNIYIGIYLLDIWNNSIDTVAISPQ